MCSPYCRYYVRGLTNPCTYIGWSGIRPCETTANTPCSNESFSRMIDTLKSENSQKTEVNINDIYRE